MFPVKKWKLGGKFIIEKMKILITSGGCKAPIDEVRHIGNFSSGRYGVELAHAFRNNAYKTKEEMDEILFFREQGSLSYKHDDTIYVNYEDYRVNMKNMIKNWKPDIIVSAAAISDYIPVKQEGKISSTEDEITITLKKTEKVIASFRELAPMATIVGFKLLVGPKDEGEIQSAVRKVKNNGADLVIYNDLLELKKGNSKRRVYYLDNYYKEAENAENVVDFIVKFHNFGV